MLKSRETPNDACTWYLCRDTFCPILWNSLFHYALIITLKHITTCGIIKHDSFRHMNPMIEQLLFTRSKRV
jgi:hypothetical protein